MVIKCQPSESLGLTMMTFSLSFYRLFSLPCSARLCAASSSLNFPEQQTRKISFLILSKCKVALIFVCTEAQNSAGDCEIRTFMATLKFSCRKRKTNSLDDTTAQLRIQLLRITLLRIVHFKKSFE